MLHEQFNPQRIHLFGMPKIHALTSFSVDDYFLVELFVVQEVFVAEFYCQAFF
jgi:hypothetical protein